MNFFINYDPQIGVTIATHRKPDAVAVDDVIVLVDYVLSEQSCCCPLDGSKDALEDGSLWNNIDQPAIELIHAAITDHEKGE